MSSDFSLQFKVDDLEKRIRTKIEVDSGFMDSATQAQKLNRIFKAFDSNGSGFLDINEFVAAMVRLNFVGVQREVEELFHRYDEDGSGMLSFEEFSAGLFGLAPNPHGSAENRAVMDRIRQKLAERGGTLGLRSLRHLIRRMDQDGSGNLDRNELLEGLSEMGLELTDEEMKKAMNVFDVNLDGKISLEELFRGVRGKLSSRRRNMILQAFDQFDRDGSGEVTLDDLKNNFDVSTHPEVQSGKKTADEVLEDFLGQFEGAQTRDGRITREEFLNYYKDISAAIDNDDYFELMIRNCWRLMGGEGVTENTANRRVLVVHSDGSQEVVGLEYDLGVGGDLEKIREQLRKQGVKDIQDISLAD